MAAGEQEIYLLPAVVPFWRPKITAEKVKRAVGVSQCLAKAPCPEVRRSAGDIWLDVPRVNVSVGEFVLCFGVLWLP